MMQQSCSREEYEIGIVTALPKEFAAVSALLENPGHLAIEGRGAGRRYLGGEVPAADGGTYHVVLTLARKGNNTAAARATLLLEHFPAVESIIMVGIAGGIPDPEEPKRHVRLGDIVVSNEKGVVQYDFHRETVEEVTHDFPPRPPSAVLLEAVRLMEAARLEGEEPWLGFIETTLGKLGWARPPEDMDVLASSADPEEIVSHPTDPERVKGRPRVFTGPIASASKLLKNPITRDELRDTFGAKAVEMEGSGIADATWNREVGYLVVRGVCDYCDSNKGDEWQQYAAVVAAAFARALIESLPSGATAGQGADSEPAGVPSDTNAANGSERFDFDLFRELFTFATVDAGMTRASARSWAEEHLGFFSRRDLKRFKGLFNYACREMGMIRTEAVDWALKTAGRVDLG